MRLRSEIRLDYKIQNICNLINIYENACRKCWSKTILKFVTGYTEDKYCVNLLKLNCCWVIHLNKFNLGKNNKYFVKIVFRGKLSLPTFLLL